MDGSGVPGTKSRNSFVSKKCPGQERGGPDGEIAFGMDLHLLAKKLAKKIILLVYW